MSIGKLFAILVALSVLIAPGVSGAAMAASPHHKMQVMEAGHCEAPPASSGSRDKMAGKSCCISMCEAVAVEPSAPTAISLLRRHMAQFAIPRTYHGHLSEIATPPPRHS